MKALIKGGLCVALSWLASGASAQELPVKWQAAGTKNSTSIAVVNPPAPKTDANMRPVTLSAPTPLDGVAPPPAMSGGFAPIIRAQAADDKTTPQPVPKLEIVIDEPKQLPPEKEKKFSPPPPQAVPSPVYGSLGVNSDTCMMAGCGPSWCGPLFGAPIGDRPRYWFGAEYLMWWQRGQSVPPLVTSSPTGTAPLLGLNTTSILYDNVPNPMRSGARFSAGMWMPHFCCNLGIEFSYFFLGRTSSSATFASNGDPVLGRPIFDTNPNNFGPNAEVFAGTLSTGSTTVSTYSQLWGLESNLRYKWCSGPSYWLDIIGGYRYLNLSEGIDIAETAVVNAPPNVIFQERESFHTRNQFNGVQLGLDGEVRLWNRWFLGGFTKVAIGDIHQTVSIDGSTTFTNFPGFPSPVTVPQALLVGPTNRGNYSQDRFGVLPEVGIKIGYDITPHLRVFVGYDCLYLSNAVRPGDQIDINVNDRFRNQGPANNFLPGVGGGPAQPAVLFRTTSYFAQGVNFGLQYRY